MTRPDAAIETARFVLFASGAAFSACVLEQLLRAGREPALIAMPGYPPAAPADGELARVETRNEFDRLAKGIPVIHVPRRAQLDAAARLRLESIDFILVACWPYLIRPELCASPRLAALNLHPSLLPRDRGPDPLTQQLARGDGRFGVTLHRLSSRFDAGNIVAQEVFTVTVTERDRARIEKQCAALGARLFLAAMHTFAEGWDERPQPD